MISILKNMAVCGNKTKTAGCGKQPAAGESLLWQFRFTSSIAREVGNVKNQELHHGHDRGRREE